MAITRFHRIAIVGASGQLGAELLRLLGDSACPLRHHQLELSDVENIRAALTAINPDCVINAAAYNWVDKAEDEPQIAFAINALGPRNLAVVCAERSIPLLHVSSDYVFGLDVATAPLNEMIAPGPNSAYGLSKLAGEYFVRSLCPQHFVVRTCGLYGHGEAVGKGNFVKTMLRLGRERGHVRVVSDQQCTPTSTKDLAGALLGLLETDAHGLYHVTNRGASSWFEFAREIFRAANLSVNTEPITTREFAAKANRPAYSVLDCQKAAGVLGFQMPSWQEAVARYVHDLPS